MSDTFEPDPDAIREAFARIPRERWATVLAMIFVLKMPAAALEQIALRGRRDFIKWGRRTDVVGLTAEDYSDIFRYIRMAVQRYHQARVAMDAARNN